MVALIGGVLMGGLVGLGAGLVALATAGAVAYFNHYLSLAREDGRPPPGKGR